MVSLLHRATINQHKTYDVVSCNHTALPGIEAFAISTLHNAGFLFRCKTADSGTDIVSVVNRADTFLV